ncbi:MAG: FISUMP domain-containing protein [Bacteroidota bacterium]
MKDFLKPIFLIVFLSILAIPSAFAEGTPQLNSNNVQSTVLYICNDFAGHCSSGAGIRSQFAAYDNTQSATDAERLYFATLSDEHVYLGFQGAISGGNHIVFRIKNLAGAVVLAEQNLPTSGTGYISNFSQAVNGPNQLPQPPITSGYNAIEFIPLTPGTYYIEFSARNNGNNAIYTGDFNLTLFDITVGNAATHEEKPGRLYSKCWQFYETVNFTGKNYFISDDGIVTSAQFSGMSGGHWIQYCNQTGCGNSSAAWITNRKSLYHQQALFPQYKIFLNSPDPVVFPPATTLGQLIAPLPYGLQNCQTGHIVFHVTVDKPGNAEIGLTFPSPYQPRTLNQAVVAGDNLFDWDGLDGTTPTGLAIPNNTTIQFTVKYINGLTNLPLYDVEQNSSGFTIALVSPAGTTPAVYWDDTNIPSGTNHANPPGCVSPPGCHPWSGSPSGDLNTMNTWWYNVSTSTNPVTIEEYRGPATLVFLQQPPQEFCANTGGHVFSVTPDVNTEEYHWTYTPATGVTINQATPGSAGITLSFGAGASSGVLQVWGTNSNCAATGPTSSLAISINPGPLPTLTGMNQVCAGTGGVVYTTSPGKTNYVWTISAGGTITSGGTSTSNTATVTWNTAGAQSISVGFTDPVTLCPSANPFVLAVTVNPHPLPTLNGSSLVCVGSSGIVYTSDPNKSNYVWTISAGGTITSGGTSTSNTATVTWNTVGAQTVSVSYTDPVTLCQALAPFILNVTVSTLPSPTFTSGLTSVCKGVPGNVYTTQAGMTSYIWAVTGGTITSGGTSASNSATITWTATGVQTVSVNYTYPASSCTAPNPTVLNVTVKPLPTPSVVSGNNSVCQGVPGNIYTTQTGMQNYVWVVSGGTITAGGSATSNSVTVTWNTVGARSVSINYTDPSTGCSAAGPSVFNVTVKALPVPSFISGENSVCLNIPGKVYVTQPAMSSYVWSVSGGVITAGGGASDNSATVTWNAAGAQSIAVSYTNPATLCTAAAPVVFIVTVNSPPSPTILSGENSVCRGSTGKIYTTQPGKLNYAWSVAGGTITAGGTSTSNSATVTWNSAGSQSVSISYTDPATLCAAAAPALYPVTVKPLPVPTISGPAAACLNSPGPQYFTEAGMSGYLWTVPGGTVTPGPTPDLINVVWNTLGTHTLLVTYTGLNGCNAEIPSQKQVLVNTLPDPILTGANTVCSGIQTTYTTDAGMQNYLWSVSPGGTINGGGTASDNTVAVTWNIPVMQHVSVNYTMGTGCTAPAPKDLGVTVNQSTTPVIEQSPAGQVCVLSSATYTAQPGMTGYQWTVSSGGSFSSSSNSNVVTILWNGVGPQWVSLNFTNAYGCSDPAPTRSDVTVNYLPVTVITAPAGPECESIRHPFQTPADPGCTFTWTISPLSLGTVASGQGSNAVIIDWLSSGNAVIHVTGTNNSSGCTTSSDYTTTVYPISHPVFIPCFDLVTTPHAKKFTLRGASPFIAGQSVFSGNRVSLNVSSGLYEFDPDGATPGAYPVTFTYTNTYGCQASPPVVEITVENNPFTCGGFLTDVRDGKKYNTSLIGGKCWMAGNLTFGNVLAADLPSTDNCINEKYCLPADAGCTTNGGLYQWDELMRYGSTSANQGVCPPEWHIPSETEWQSLLLAVESLIVPPDGIAGSYMKDAYLDNGFHALLGGLLYFNDTWAYTSGNVTGTLYWTSTPSGTDRAMARGMNLFNPSVSRYTASRANAFSVRCVKD